MPAVFDLSLDLLTMASVGPLTRRWLQLGLGVIIVVLVAGSVLSWLTPQTRTAQVAPILRDAQAALLFAAASLGLLSGRWAARTSAGFACATLLILAFAGITSAASLGETGFGPVMYTGGAALAVVMLLGAAAAPEVNDSMSLRRVLSRESGPVALLLLAAFTPVMDAVLVAGMTMPMPARIVQSSLLAAGCCIAAVQVLRVDRPRLGWLPAALGILAVAAMVHAFGGVWPRSLLVALGLQTLAGAVALASAVIELRSALVGTRDGMTSMLQDLGAMRDENSRRRAEESERLHEVRSVLAGLYAARDTLRKYEDTLESADRRRLQDAVGEELGRLNQLIDPVLRADIEDLRLADVLASVVLAEREQGLVVTTDLAEVRVRGRAAEIATLVSDLLVNARVHAPGSAVRLTARLDAGMVALDVRNWGPELSASEGERVFERTYRGARSVADGVPGSGLGLYTARKLALQMNGDVQHLTPVGGGCCFVVTLPVAKADAGVAPSLQGATQNRGAVDPHPVPQHVAASRAPEPHIATPHRSLPIAVDGTQRWPERVGNKLVSGGQRTLQRYGQTR